MIFVFTIVLMLPFLFDPLINRASDLDGNITQVLYIKNTLINHHMFPQWNPYINQGLPISADPLHSAFHPFVLPAFIFFEPHTAVKMLYFISLYSGGIGLYFLLKRLKISPSLNLLIACTYMSCGYFSSHMVAGHFEKILSFGILPWFIASLYEVFIQPRQLTIIFTAIGMTLMLFSGDLYNTLYACILIMMMGIFSRSMKIMSASVQILIYVFLLGAIKLIPLIELQNFIGKVREPFAGSQNFISMVYYFFIPFKSLYWFLGVGEYLKTGFAWWEKISYIGPFILLGMMLFLADQKKYVHQVSKFFMILLIALIALSMPQAYWNPYHWIIRYVPYLQLFHVPSRVFGMLTVIFLSMAALGFEKWYKKGNSYTRVAIIGLVLFNLLSTGIFFICIVNYKNMPLTHSDSSTELIRNIKRRDDRTYYIAQYLQKDPLQQYKLIGMGQKILNSNYGLQLKNSPAAAFTQFDFTHASYSDIQPMYIVGGGESIRIPHGAHPKGILRENDLVLYENSEGDSYATLAKSGKVVDSVLIKPNRISVNITSSKEDQLTLLESSYPGWSVYEDGKNIKLIPGRFLQTTVKKGKHTYTFKFQSSPFLIGLGISCIAWTVALATLWRKRNILHT